MIAPIEVAPGSAPQLVKVIRVSQGARKQVVFKLTDDSGKPVNLKEEVENPPAPPVNGTTFAPQAEAVGANVTVTLVQRATGDLWGPVVFEVVGTVLDQDQFTGFVEFIIKTENTMCPGIYSCYIQRTVPGNHIVDTWPVLVAVEPPSILMLSGTGPLLIPEIRLALLDLDNQVGANSAFSNLLDNVEFQDLEIIFAMRRVIDLWNETPPPVITYSASGFPYRYHWLQGTCAQLLLMGAARYRRNRLAYQAGGVAIDDQSKAGEYEEIGNQRMAEFMTWMRNEKYRMNMNAAWGIGL